MMFKAILCLAFVANAVVAVPSHSRRHHDLAVRMASPNHFEPVAVVQKRSNSGRCKPRPTTTSATTSATATATKVVGNVASAPPTSTEVHSSSEEPSKPSSSPSPTSTKASSTHASSSSQPTQSQSSGGGGDTYSGDGTYYDTGLVACGETFTDSDMIVAVSHALFDSFPGYNGVNPNNNPICGKTLTAHYNGNSVTVTAQDRCGGCEIFGSLDFTPAAIAKLEPNYLEIGRIHGVTWSFD